MEWLEKSYKRPLFVQHLFKEPAGRIRHNLGAAVLVIGCLPLTAHAYEILPTQAGRTAIPLHSGGLRKMSDQDLAKISAKGFTDGLFDKISSYASHGNGVEILGDLATLLNPALALIDPDATFRNAIFNPTNPSVVIDRDGTAMIRLQRLGSFFYQYNPSRTSRGASAGSVQVNGVDLSGTTIFVKTRR